MFTLADKSEEIVGLSNIEAKVAHDSSQAIAHFVQDTPFENDDERLQLTLSRETGEQIDAQIPAKALRLLAYILEEMAQGNPITLIPLHAELSTNQAAEIIHVSQPYLISILEAGKIPFRKVGAHRRVRYDDLLSYIDREKKAREETLKELITESESLGLYE